MVGTQALAHKSFQKVTRSSHHLNGVKLSGKLRKFSKVLLNNLMNSPESHEWETHSSVRSLALCDVTVGTKACPQ